MSQSLPVPNLMFPMEEIMHKSTQNLGPAQISPYRVGTNSHFQNKHYSRIDCVRTFPLREFLLIMLSSQSFWAAHFVG